MAEELLNCSLFAGLTLEEIKDLIDNVNYQIKSYPKEFMIKLANDECSSLFIVIKGVVRGEMTDMSGKILKVEDIPAPNAVASAFLFGKNNRFPVNVVANMDCELLIIPKIEFINLLQKNQKVLINYLNMICGKAQFLSSRLNILSLKDLRAKLAHYLLQQTQNGKIISFTMSQNQTKLADFFGVARPSLARSFKQLIEDGVIEAKRNNVKIKDIERLREMIS